MRMMLLGSPGVGKGTQAALICDTFGIPQISTGNILRAAIEAGGDLGKLAKTYIDEGQLVPDDVVIAVVKERLGEKDCQNGFLLDGFPRTIAQAQALVDSGLNLDHVIALEISDDEVVSRLSGRRIHLSSGRTYHVKFNPPREEGVDDETGEPLIQREDDSEEVVRHRLKVYHEQTSPLIGFYKEMAAENKVKFSSISGVGDVDDVFSAIKKILL